MTDETKKSIFEMRKSSLGYKAIAANLNMIHNPMTIAIGEPVGFAFSRMAVVNNMLSKFPAKPAPAKNPERFDAAALERRLNLLKY